eukprot:TRINITY_DN4614_c0_g1_i3.p2 TRINITY_DN4614_c0_g1~~TRINITY_DN4614_c0_g1_i3.p2  ORF type:complete len:282 (-),score=-5.54 TRINITY_DN4614_c0_g1_i3:83-928(-)
MLFYVCLSSLKKFLRLLQEELLKWFQWNEGFKFHSKFFILQNLIIKRYLNNSKVYRGSYKQIQQIISINTIVINNDRERIISNILIIYIQLFFINVFINIQQQVHVSQKILITIIIINIILIITKKILILVIPLLIKFSKFLRILKYLPFFYEKNICILGNIYQFYIVTQQNQEIHIKNAVIAANFLQFLKILVNFIITLKDDKPCRSGDLQGLFFLCNLWLCLDVGEFQNLQIFNNVVQRLLLRELFSLQEIVIVKVCFLFVLFTVILDVRGGFKCLWIV